MFVSSNQKKRIGFFGIVETIFLYEFYPELCGKFVIAGENKFTAQCCIFQFLELTKSVVSVF